MTERMGAFLNAMTIVGMVLVSFILVAGSALLIMFAAGMFNKHYDPLVGLKFSSTQSLVIEETEGQVYLTVVANTAQIGEDGDITDNTMDTDIILTVRNSNDVIDNTVIEVPRTVKKGVPFAIKAKTLEDGYNKGGISYIYAETSDMMYRVAAPIAVMVDVPVESIKMVAKDPNSSKPIDLDTTKFIYEDLAQLDVEVTPARAQYIYGDTTQKKSVVYVSGNPRNAEVNMNTGLMNIEYNPAYTEEEPLTEPLDFVSITAKINKYGDNNEERQVTTTNRLGLFPVQLGQILIKNELYSGEEAVFSTQLFSESNVLKVSAEETGLSDVVNLQIFLQPTIVKDSQDPNHTPLSDLSEFTLDFEVEDDVAPNYPALDISQKVATHNGKSVFYWEIVPNRLIESNEKVYLVMNLLDRSESFAVKREVQVQKTDADVNTFYYTNASGVEITNVKLEITKYDDDEENNDYGTGFAVNYTYSAAVSAENPNAEPSFKKVVTFASKPSDANVGDNVNVNEVNSQIIVANTENYQITSETQDGSGFVIEPRGAGAVAVTPYLVRTNRLGQPVDVNYNIITTDSSLWGTAGYVEPSGLCRYLDIENAQPGQYIWYQTFRQFNVTVSEKLVHLDLYQDTSDFTEPKIDGTMLMGTQRSNTVTIYARPNSVLALPDSTESFYAGKYNYSDIEIEEFVPQSGTKIFTDLTTDLMGSAKSYGNNALDMGEGGKYARWIKFDVTAAAPTTTIEGLATAVPRQIQLRYNGYVSALQINAVDVPIAKIQMDKQFDTFTNGVNYWSLQPQIASGSVLYNNNYYSKIDYVDMNGSELILPDAECLISPENEELGLKAPSSQNYSTKLYLLQSGSYDVAGSTYSLGDMIASATSTNVDKTIRDQLWEAIEALISDSIIGGKNSADDYAQFRNIGGGLVKMDIKQALPQGTELYMFYVPLEGGMELDFADVSPAIVRIIYNWPTLSASMAPVNVPYEEEGGTRYYLIYGTEGQDVRKFGFYQMQHTEAIVISAAGQTSQEIMNTYLVNMNPNGAFSTAVVKEGEDNLFTFTVSTSATEGSDPDNPTVVTVTITRTVYFVTDSSIDVATWDAMVLDSIENSGLVYDEYTQKLSQTGVAVSNTWEEVIRFKIKEIVDSGEGEGEGEGSEGSQGENPTP